MVHKENSQTSRILRYLKKGRSLTPLQALTEFSTLRLSGRIKEMRADGWNIKTEMIKVGMARVARYTLDKKWPRMSQVKQRE